MQQPDASYPEWVYKEPKSSVRSNMCLRTVSIIDPDSGVVLAKRVMVLPSTERVARAVSIMKKDLIRRRKAELDDYWSPKRSK